MIKIGDKKYMEIEEYALSKNKTIQTVYNWIKNKDIKTRKMFNKTLIEI